MQNHYPVGLLGIAFKRCSFSKFYSFPVVRVSLIAILFLMCFTFSEAQVLRVGPKAGILASQPLHDEPAYREEFRSIPALGFQAGAAMNVKVSERFSLQSEFMYQRVGKHVKSNFVSDFHKERFDYLSLPLLLQASHRIGYSEFYINAGPSVSYWLGGKGKVKTGEVLEEGIEVLDYTITFDRTAEANNVFFVGNNPNLFQLGLDVGGGVYLPVGAQLLMLDLRYTWGHTNMVREQESYIPISFFNDDLRHSHQTLTLSVAYLFSFDIYQLSTKGKSTSGKK